MPINTIYPFHESIHIINSIYDISGDKPCVGIMLFNKFHPKGREFSYSNSVEKVTEVLTHLDPTKCRLSFCEYNPSFDVGTAEEYPIDTAEHLLMLATDMGFEAKLFSSFGREKQTACGLLGGREPEKLVPSKWEELDKMADELILKYAN